MRTFERFTPGEDALRVTVGPWPAMIRFLEALDDVLATMTKLAPSDLEMLR